MTTSVHELELPELDLFGVPRDEVAAQFARAREQHWLARNPMGYSVVRYEDVVAILRDRRFHSALSMLACRSACAATRSARISSLDSIDPGWVRGAHRFLTTGLHPEDERHARRCSRPTGSLDT